MKLNVFSFCLESCWALSLIKYSKIFHPNEQVPRESFKRALPRGWKRKKRGDRIPFEIPFSKDFLLYLLALVETSYISLLKAEHEHLQTICHCLVGLLSFYTLVSGDSSFIVRLEQHFSSFTQVGNFPTSDLQHSQPLVLKLIEVLMSSI